MNSLIQPAYGVPTNSDHIELGCEKVELHEKQKTYRGTGKARLKLRPNFRLSIDARFPDLTGGILEALSAARTVQVGFGQNFDPIKAQITELNIHGDDASTVADATFLPNPQRIVSRTNSALLIDHLIFHITNFPQFLDLSKSSSDLRYQKPSGGWQLLGRAFLNNHLWQTEIQELPNAKSIISQLVEKGGYSITHVGRLTRRDGNPFTAQAAEKAVQDLYLFLSFARGAWTPPILCVGYDATGVKNYENWGIRIGTPWESRQGWFDLHHAAALSTLYPKFVSLLHHRKLGKAVANSLYWYLRSNRGGAGTGIDSGIILSQAALERLSSTYLIDFLSIKAKPKNASALLREALNRLGIPVQIPESLVSLVENRDKGLWTDGPDAITRVRNELIHPNARLAIKIGTVIPDTWRLAQWYIELIILRLSAYNGPYSNRLAARWLGEVEDVPWIARNADERGA